MGILKNTETILGILKLMTEIRVMIGGGGGNL
jgi:hypothetical protein